MNGQALPEPPTAAERASAAELGFSPGAVQEAHGGPNIPHHQVLPRRFRGDGAMLWLGLPFSV